jgi:hypothetical protein
MPLTLLANRETRRRLKNVDEIKGVGICNVVVRTATELAPALSYVRGYYGISAECPPVNGRRQWAIKDLRLLSNTSAASHFVHTAMKCTGEYGTVLRFPGHIVRIGRYSVVHAILNIVRFMSFTNCKGFTGMSVSNMVFTGTCKRRLDRKSLIGDKRSNKNTKFPGVSINLPGQARKTKRKSRKANTKIRCTPSIFTSKVTKFNIAGVDTLDILYTALAEVNDLARTHAMAGASQGAALPTVGKGLQGQLKGAQRAVQEIREARV